MADVQTIELADEDLDITRRTVNGETVRVSVHVDSAVKSVEVPLTTEHVTIETVEIGREVAEVPTVRTEGDVTIVPVVEEEAVVVKRLILKQELRITKTRTETTAVHTVPLRSEHAVVERFSSPNSETET